MGVKILHISDFHVSKGNPFHKLLLEKIPSLNLGVYDYVFLTGDFGNYADDDNVQEAISWTKQFLSLIEVKDKKIFCCQGNHDLNAESLPPGHYLQGHSYKSGQEYISSTNYNTIFDPFLTFSREFSLKDGVMPLSDNGDFFYSDDNCNIVLLNSSSLSQYSETDYKRITDSFGNPKLVFKNNLDEHFNGNQCTDSGGNFSIKSTLNYVENTSQQVFDAAIRNDLLKPSNKINILIQHHPEASLHNFSKFGIHSISSSGTIARLAEHYDLLICGHIHPAVSRDRHNLYYNIVHLIGAGCHHNDKLDTGIWDLFYSYDVQKHNNELQIERTTYRFHDENKEIQFNKSIVNSKIAQRTNTLQLSIGEDEYNDVKINIRKCVRESLELAFFKKIETSILHIPISIPTGKKQKIPYYITKEVFHVMVDNKLIIFDPIFFDELFFPDHLLLRLSCVYENHVSDNASISLIPKSIKIEDIFYQPLIFQIGVTTTNIQFCGLYLRLNRILEEARKPALRGKRFTKSDGSRLKIPNDLEYFLKSNQIPYKQEYSKILRMNGINVITNAIVEELLMGKNLFTDFLFSDIKDSLNYILFPKEMPGG